MRRIDKCLILKKAGNGIRTHDLLITNQLHYHCAIPAKSLNCRAFIVLLSMP
jgi:hypothetical protein